MALLFGVCFFFSYKLNLIESHCGEILILTNVQVIHILSMKVHKSMRDQSISHVNQ
jgi:hypothetical protein